MIFNYKEKVVKITITSFGYEYEFWHAKKMYFAHYRTSEMAAQGAREKIDELLEYGDK